MAGKVVIYGGSGGIGAATARALAARGHALHLVGRDGRFSEIRDLAAVDAFLADLEART